MSRFVLLLLGRLWALPLSLAALLAVLGLWLLNARSLRWERARDREVHALWLSSPAVRWLLRRHPAGPMLALCVGQVVFSREPLAGCDDALVRHELCHVRQAQRWGPMFPFVYLGASALALWRGEGAYWGNVFEREARAAEVADNYLP